jgi:hypothetical protein|tara:strand:- start:422 stop:727 length:306 start_codon:yes stop_codon:yes gene_type:complete
MKSINNHTRKKKVISKIKKGIETSATILDSIICMNVLTSVLAIIILLKISIFKNFGFLKLFKQKLSSALQDALLLLTQTALRVEAIQQLREGIQEISIKSV